MAKDSIHEGGLPPEGGKWKRRRRNPMVALEDIMVVLSVALYAEDYATFKRGMLQGLSSMRRMHFGKALVHLGKPTSNPAGEDSLPPVQTTIEVARR